MDIKINVMLGLFRSLKNRKLDIDLEARKYKADLIQKIDLEVRELESKAARKKAKLNKGVEELAISCANDRADYEHTYHSEMERLGINIARQESRLELLKNDEEIYNRLIEEKNAEIARMQGILDKLIDTFGDR